VRSDEGVGNSSPDALVLVEIMAPLDRYSCEEVFRRMDEYLDRELAPDEAARVRLHLETCVACASEYAFEESVLLTVKAKLRRVEMPPALRTRIERQLGSSRSQ
jgi:anti-sigma factor (TIGR02949 family)